MPKNRIACVLSPAQTAVLKGQSRRALVIVNGDYRTTADGGRPFELLKSPMVDGKVMTDALCSLGFETRFAENLDSAGLKETFKAFTADNRGDTALSQVRLVYYRGHGIQAGGANYLVPVDAAVETAVCEGS